MLGTGLELRASFAVDDRTKEAFEAGAKWSDKVLTLSSDKIVTLRPSRRRESEAAWPAAVLSGTALPLSIKSR